MYEYDILSLIVQRFFYCYDIQLNLIIFFFIPHYLEIALHNPDLFSTYSPGPCGPYLLTINVLSALTYTVLHECADYMT